MQNSRQPVWRLWITASAIAWFGVGGRPVVAHDGEEPHEHAPPAADLKEVYKPTVMPDRIILTWTGDPAVTQAVTWRTSTEVAEAWAEIARAEAGPAFAKNATKIQAASQALLSDLSTAHFHTVQFKDLTPSTKYAYRVGDGINWSEWFHFATASDKAEPFSFIYFGDAQNDIRSMWSRVIREAYSDAPKARFMIHAGDLINKAEADAEWGAWFGAGAWLNAMIPSVPIPGNHEQAKDEDGKRRLSHHWRPQFALPKNGPIGLEETCYTLVYQGVRIIGLDSNDQIDEQAVWVDQVLAENKCPWVVCTFHHPIFSTGKDRDNPALRAAWKPIFDKYRVDLVLQGHDHTYGRTGLATPVRPARPASPEAAVSETVGNVPAGVNKVDEQTGTVYVVSVSGPKMYKLQRQPFMPRQAENTQLYQIIQIDGGTLRYEARTAVGEIYDAFTLVKRSGEINELIEQIPDTPARIASEETPPTESVHTAKASVLNETANDQDDMCVWVCRDQSEGSLIIGSDKSADAVFVYDLQGALRQTLPVPKPGNIDIRQDLLINGRRRDLVVVNQRGGETQLRAFEVDRDSRKLVPLQGALPTEDNYGGCLYWNEKSNSLFFATTSDLGTVRLYQLLADEQDVWTTKLTRSWNIGKCEGAVADDAAGTIYVAEEKKGIWKFDAGSSADDPGKLVIQVGEHGIRGDLEGLELVETRGGRSLLIASDQGANRFVVFDRQHGHRYCGSFRIEGAEDSDGIAVARAPLGSRFPAGVFCCHTDVAPRPILLTAWEEIEQALFPSK